MTVGDRIKIARIKCGLSQRALAERLNIPYQSISQYERGTRNPKRETLDRIANALGINRAELYDEKTASLIRTIDNPIIKDTRTEAEIKRDLEEYAADMEEISLWGQFDHRGRKLLSAYFDLNDEGQDKAVDYVQLLAENEKYLK